MGHRRHVHSETMCKGTTGSSRGEALPARSGAGVRSGTQNGSEDAGVFSAAWLPAAEAGMAAEPGSMASCHRRHSGRREAPATQAGGTPPNGLQSTGSEAGPSGGKLLTQTTFIQRLNTKGGSAPDTGCSVLSDVENQTLVPYTADYYFFPAHD